MTLVFVSLWSQSRLSSTSVVFDFNASLNDVAPVSLIMFPVVILRMKKKRFAEMSLSHALAMYSRLRLS